MRRDREAAWPADCSATRCASRSAGGHGRGRAARSAPRWSPRSTSALGTQSSANRVLQCAADRRCRAAAAGAAAVDADAAATLGADRSPRARPTGSADAPAARGACLRSDAGAARGADTRAHCATGGELASGPPSPILGRAHSGSALGSPVGGIERASAARGEPAARGARRGPGDALCAPVGGPAA